VTLLNPELEAFESGFANLDVFQAREAFDPSHLCSPLALLREKLGNVNYVKYGVKSFEISKSCAYTQRRFQLLKTSSLLAPSIRVSLHYATGAGGRVEWVGAAEGLGLTLPVSLLWSHPAPCSASLSALRQDPKANSSFKS